jgi:integrase/recombinase XerC
MENDTPLAPSTVNVKMAAVRSLVHCAAAEGWISEQDDEQILKRVKSRPVAGRREGQFMPLSDVQRCLRLPDSATLAGKRDYALLGVLFACGLRRGRALQPRCEDHRPTERGLGPDRSGRKAPEGALDSAGGADQAGN